MENPYAVGVGDVISYELYNDRMMIYVPGRVDAYINILPIDDNNILMFSGKDGLSLLTTNSSQTLDSIQTQLQKYKSILTSNKWIIVNKDADTIFQGEFFNYPNVIQFNEDNTIAIDGYFQAGFLISSSMENPYAVGVGDVISYELYNDRIVVNVPGRVDANINILPIDDNNIIMFSDENGLSLLTTNSSNTFDSIQQEQTLKSLLTKHEWVIDNESADANFQGEFFNYLNAIKFNSDNTIKIDGYFEAGNLISSSTGNPYAVGETDIISYELYNNFLLISVSGRVNSYVDIIPLSDGRVVMLSRNLSSGKSLLMPKK